VQPTIEGRIKSVSMLKAYMAAVIIVSLMHADWSRTARAVMTTNKTTRHTVSNSRRESVQLDSPAVSPPVTGHVQRLSDALHNCQIVMMKESPLTVLGLSTKRSPKISEIIQQTKVLCEVRCPSKAIILSLSSLL